MKRNVVIQKIVIKVKLIFKLGMEEWLSGKEKQFAEKCWKEKLVVDKCLAHFEIIVSSSRTRTRSSRRMLLGYLRLGKKTRMHGVQRELQQGRANNRELATWNCRDYLLDFRFLLELCLRYCCHRYDTCFFVLFDLLINVTVFFNSLC